MTDFYDDDRDRKDSCDYLKSILIDKLIFNESCEIRNGGIYATNKIKIGEVIVGIPFEDTINVERICKSPLKVIFDSNPGLIDYEDELLAIGLMWGCVDKTCDWYYHIETMPKTFNTPLFWNDDELEYLNGCNVYFITKMLKNQIINDWNNIYIGLKEEFPNLLGDNKINIDLYKWALAAIYSRACGFQRNGKYTRCIAPILDMANHHPIASGTDGTKETFLFENEILKLMNTIERNKSDECYAIYGTYTNSKLLFTYGFTLDTNLIPYSIDLWPNLNKLSSYKMNKINSLDLTKYASRYDFTGSIRGSYHLDLVEFDSALLNLVRIINCNNEEDKDDWIKINNDDYKGGIISHKNELATFVSLYNMFIGAIKRLQQFDMNNEEKNEKKLEMANKIRQDDIHLLQKATQSAKIRMVQLNKSIDN